MGKKLTVYLIDGTEFGPKTIEIGNWSGKALYTSRFSANEFLNRSEFNSCGIYILKSISENEDFLEKVYIGEAEILKNRIRQHLKDTDKDFFTELIVFTSPILTKAHIKYLESKLIKESKEAKTAEIENQQIADLPYLPEADISDMEYFFDQIKLILPVIDFKLLTPSVIKPKETNENFSYERNNVYKIKHSALHAQMFESDKGFIVIKGSQARKDTTGSLSETYRLQKQRLIDNGILIDRQDYYVFTEDTVFKSISPAANIVLGRQSNGTTEWLAEDGQTYKDKQSEIFH